MPSPPPPAGTAVTGHRWRQRLRFTVGTVVAIGVLWFAVSDSGGPSVAWRVLGHTSPGWLAAAVAAQALSFLAAAVRLQRLLGRALPLGRAVALWLELAMNGLWVLAPAAPAEALAYGAGQLRRRGLDRARTGLVLGLEQWFTFRIIYLVGSSNLLVVLATRDFPVGGPWPPTLAIAVLIVLAWTAVLARRPESLERMSRLWARVRFWAPRPTDEEHRHTAAMLHETAMSVLGTAGNRLRLVSISLVGYAFGVLSLLYSMRAVGLVVDLDLILLASALALVVSSVPLLPAGLGTVEAAVPALLHWYGAPLGQALAGAVVARVVGTLLPALAGGLAIVVLRGPAPLPAPSPTPTMTSALRVLSSRWKAR